MQYEYDPEKLIEEVKKRPGIWDFDNPDYRAKNVRHKLWTEVVNELMQSDVKVTKSEMRELELQLQKKWKSIRDCFQKYVSNPSRTRRPYVYSKNLQFLLKDSPLPRMDSNHDEESSDNEQEKRKKRKSSIWRHKARIKLAKDDSSADEDNEDNYYYDQLETNSSHEEDTHQRTSKVKENTDEFVFANVDPHNSTRSDGDDPDKLFLLSLLPHLKSIPEEFRLNVKVDMMQVLQNGTYAAVKEHKLI